MKGILKNTYLHSGLFWIISFIVLYQLFTLDYNNGKVDFLYTLFFNLPLIAVVYINGIGIRLFFLKKRYGFYLLIIIASIILGIALFRLTFLYLTDLLFPDFYLALYYSNTELLQFILVYIVLSLLLLLSRNWFILQGHQLKLEKENHFVKLENLKTQLNPHFLFNSLNNIYALIPTENKPSRKYILQLSDALRYMIYDTDDKMVLLEEEIKYLQNYVALEKLRMPGGVKVDLTIQGNMEGYVIAPLILLPLVENCFKHCNREEPDISILIRVEDDRLEMKTTNNKKIEPTALEGGLGSRNLKNRLEMIYPERYHFKAENHSSTYQTFLKILLSDENV